MELEKRGVPSIVVITDAFLTMATLERRALGRPNLQLLVLDHPLMNKNEATLESVVDGFAGVLSERFGGGRG